MKNLWRRLYTFLKKYSLHVAWAQAFIGTVLSLYFSEVLNWAPCVLCWYQRIFLYPLVAILPIGILRRDKDLPLYVMPFSVAGMLVAFYQVLLEHNIFPEPSCSYGISCKTTYINWFGFITIPFLSLIAFGIITLCMVLYIQHKKVLKI